jgi:hypothetical protein
MVENKNVFSRRNLTEKMEVSLTFKSYRVFEAQEGHAEVRAKLKDLGYIE